jgi:hypothetical protein
MTEADTTGIAERLLEHIEAYERRDADVFIANEWIPDIDIDEIKAIVSLIERLTSERDALKAIVSDLVKAAEPFVRTANNYRARDPNYIGFGRSGTGYKDFDLGDLRSLSEAVARAGKEVK